MLLKEVIRPTLIARSVMNHDGNVLVYTNSYKHCRTVKCYGGSERLTSNLTEALTVAGVKNFKVKVQRSRGWASNENVTIVRIPRTEQA